MLLPAFALAAAATSALAGDEPPHLRTKGMTQQLIVDGAPFLLLGGELGNSTASDLKYFQFFARGELDAMALAHSPSMTERNRSGWASTRCT